MKEEHRQSSEDSGILRISYDAKNKVAIGDFSRGGKNWTKVEAGDHDFAKEHLTPFGFYLPDYKETTIYLVDSKVTAACIVDLLTDYWQTIKHRFPFVHTLLLNADNGPECHSRRTQFMQRICEFSAEQDIHIKLCYYPPYHSKYNPVFKFVESFTWANKKAKVFLWNQTYEIGKKLTAKAMEKIETAIDRFNDHIGKWFIDIYPCRVRDILFSG